MTRDSSAFERQAAHNDPPMYLVTATADGAKAGCLVGFATQCSIEPLRFVVCVSKANHTHTVASRASSLVVHALHESDREVASLFGEHTGDEIDKFARCDWDDVPDGVALRGCDWFSGPIVGHFDGGDLDGYIIDVVDGRARRGTEPQLGSQAVKSFEPGHPASDA